MHNKALPIQAQHLSQSYRWRRFFTSRARACLFSSRLVPIDHLLQLMQQLHKQVMITALLAAEHHIHLQDQLRGKPLELKRGF